MTNPLFPLKPDKISTLINFPKVLFRKSDCRLGHNPHSMHESTHGPETLMLPMRLNIIHDLLQSLSTLLFLGRGTDRRLCPTQLLLSIQKLYRPPRKGTAAQWLLMLWRSSFWRRASDVKLHFQRHCGWTQSHS